MTAENFYEILNCSRNSTFEEIKQNYQRLILKHHHDKRDFAGASLDLLSSSSSNTNNIQKSSGGCIKYGNEIFIKINEAWNTLRDHEKRKLYDAELWQKRSLNQCNVYAELTVKDFCKHVENEDGDENDGGNSGLLTYSCRCGGYYVFDENLEKKFNLNDTDLAIECDECSLIVIVKHCTT